MSEFWNRSIIVETDDVTFTYPDMQINFKVEFEEVGDPPEAIVQLYNLTQETENLIKTGNQLTLKAGYKGSEGILIVGEIINVEAYHNRAERICEVHIIGAADVLRKQIISMTFAEGVKASYILKTILDEYDIEHYIQLTDKMDITYPSGRAVKGRIKSVLQSIVKDTEGKMYMKGQTVYIVPESYAERIDFLLNKDSGMIQSPTRKDSDKGRGDWEVISLINPEIQIGTILQISSKTANGEYRVVSGKHESSGKNYYTTVEVVGI